MAAKLRRPGMNVCVWKGAERVRVTVFAPRDASAQRRDAHLAWPPEHPAGIDTTETAVETRLPSH